ncbi:MAG: hypothetical protein PUB18_00495 [bacterium]|nr:hypothetical protein [bacterium]
MNAKKKKRKVNINTTTTNNEINTMIKIFIGVIVVFGATYLIAALITGDIQLGAKETKEDTVAEIQYEEILAGESLNRSDEEYYVLYFNFTENIASSYLTLKDIYATKEEPLPFYIVDLEKGFNQRFVSEEIADTKNMTIETLKVKKPTIIKVKNKKIVEYKSGGEEVLNYLVELVK